MDFGEGFRENERRGFLGKIISILDNGIDMSQYNIDIYIGRYKNADIKKAITDMFTKKEFVMIINKINQCNPNTFMNHSFQNEGNCVKIYDYLTLWRRNYFDGQDMTNFLCGMIGDIRKNRDKITNTVISRVADKTNTDVAGIVKQYIKGGKVKKTKRKRRRRRITKKRKIN